MFIRDLGSRLCEVTGEDKAHIYLLQRLVVAVMRGNEFQFWEPYDY